MKSEPHPSECLPPSSRAKARHALGAKVLRIVLPFGIVMAGWGAYILLSRQPEQAKAPLAEKPPIRTKVMELSLQDYAVTLKAHGVVQPHNEIVLSAQVSGRIIRVSPAFEDGAFFAEGDALVELESEDYQTAVALAKARLLGAEAALELAGLNHERNLEFVENQLIAQAEVDQSAATLAQAQAEVDSAASQLRRAERDLERTRIRAPFDGRVRRRSVGPGQLVGPGTALGTLFAVDYAEVRLPIAAWERSFVDLPEIAGDPPLPVELRDAIHDDPERVWKGVIVRTEGALDENSLELFAVARVEDPFGRTTGAPPLRVGQPVIGLIRGQVLTNVLALPRVAVRKLDQVYLVDLEQLTLRTQRIEAVWSDENHVIVQDTGLAEGYALATTHLVYAPHDAKVEIIPDIEPGITNSATTNVAGVITNRNAGNQVGQKNKT